MRHCSSKSDLMSILEKTAEHLVDGQATTATSTPETRMKVSIVDAMAEVQALDKPAWITNCNHLADHFTSRVFQKYSSCDELRLVFDRYDIPLSLKTATRISRQGSHDPIYYKITDTTHIAKVPLKKLVSHVHTKMELTQYLARRTLVKGVELGIPVVVAWSSQCEASHKDVSHLQSSQEEADTKLLLHAVDATATGATTIEIISPDTDVFVLALRRYPSLCPNTFFVTGRGERHRRIPLEPIVRSLGPAKTAALPAFHAWSGADITGSFAGKGKSSCWKALLNADDDVVDAFSCLGTTLEPTPRTVAAVEKLTCQLYLPQTSVSQLKDLRWMLFRKKQAESEKLPPTQAALKEAILRAHYQVMVWNHDVVPNPQLPSAQNYGWMMEQDEWVPVMTQQKPAPDAVIQLIKCGCTKENCSNNRCQCRKAGLACTDICSCHDGDELCENDVDVEADEREEDLLDLDDNSDAEEDSDD